jgi:1-aminocyclopropane-1-carboxylate deaminase
MKMGLITEYHFGGYGKVNQDLVALSISFENNNIPLDPIYTGRWFWRYGWYRENYFPAGSKNFTDSYWGIQGIRRMNTKLRRNNYQ